MCLFITQYVLANDLHYAVSCMIQFSENYTDARQQMQTYTKMAVFHAYIYR